MTTAAAENEAIETGDDNITEASYEKAFSEQVAKREAEKAGEAAPVVASGEASPAPTAQAAAPAAVATPAATDDLAELPEAARVRVKAAEDRAKKLALDNRSMAGRMSAYQRRYEEAAGKRPAEVQAKATVEQTEDWEQFKTDYPDIAGAIESKFAAQQPTADATLAQVVEFVESEKRNRFLHDAWDAVESVHPGWRDTGKTPEFQAWRKTSQTYDKLAASDDIADAIALFDLYAGHQAQAGTAPRVDPAEVAESRKLAARREAQSEGAQSPANRTQVPNENVDLNDADQLFAFYAGQSNKRLKDRYK